MLGVQLFCFVADLSEAAVFLSLGLAIGGVDYSSGSGNGSGGGGEGDRGGMPVLSPALWLWATVGVLVGRLHVYALIPLCNACCGGADNSVFLGPFSCR